MKILVTGGAGFIGSHLVDKLVELGHDITVWDNFTTGKKENINSKVKFYDISVEYIEPQFHTLQYEIIYHLAGETRIQPSFERPIVVHDSNVTGTLKMLELARLNKSHFVFAGSSSVYYDMFANPYTFSKQIAENYCTMYSKIYGVSTAIARFFNVYGSRQLEEGNYATVMGIFEKQKREGKKLTITGDGEQRRDFTHVGDIVDGLISMGDKHWNGEVFNLGTGSNYSINELAKMFNCPYEYIPKRRGEAPETLADIEFSQEKIGYNPKHKIEDYISKL